MPFSKPNRSSPTRPAVAIIMGSVSDWSVMSHTARMLDSLGISYLAKVVSAHRTPDLMFEFSQLAKKRGYKLIIAGAGGAAHLPGMVASLTTLPVIGVPIASTDLKGLDSLLSIVQMPSHSPVATMAIGVPGAKNAGLMAASILALSDAKIASQLTRWRRNSKQAVLDTTAFSDSAGKDGKL